MGTVVVEVLDGRGAVRDRVYLAELPATIGRAYDNAVVLDDPYVDPVHARIVAANGWVAVEDAGSVNGITASGDTVRIGRTTLRLVDPTRPLAPALVDGARATPAARWLTRPAVAWGICGATFLLFLVSQLASATQRASGGSILGALLALGTGLGVWTAGWSVINRLVAHRFQFMAHLAVAALSAAAIRLFIAVTNVVAFLYPADGGAILIFLGLSTILVLPIALHLGLISTMPRARRWRIAFAVSGGLWALISIAAVADRRKFSATMDFDSDIEPLPARWIPAESADAFFAATRKLQPAVDKLATERP
jgi:FHA domain-containing protein